jgi:putative ABC transport system permease protein
MLLKSILTAFRQLYRNPATSIFNIAGLALGVTTFTLLLFYIQKESRYDQHNVQPEQLYRVVNNYRIEKDHNTTAWTAPGLVTYVQGQVPGITEAVRLFRYRSPVVMVDREADKNFTEPSSMWADANVFRVFHFDFISGDPDQALTRPKTMVITESMARKYYSTIDVIGKVLSDITMGADFEITGVVRDMPESSHFRADFLCSLSTLLPLWGAEILDSWTNGFLYTYVRINPNTTPGAVEATINQEASKHIQTNAQYSSQFALQPVTDIHLHSNILNEWQPNSDIRYIYILTAVAALILLVSAINYINLWIARSEQRTKEIGIRQAVGGSKMNLGMQFTVESLTHVVISLLISVTLVGLSMPLIKKLLGENILPSQSVQTMTWLYVFLGVMIFMLLVMLYPARIISRIRPALAIKGRQAGARGGINLWEGLIAFQILVTACLITGTMLINKQLSFIKEQPLGYDVEHLLNISQLSNIPLRDRLKEALLTNSNVKSASGVSHLVGGTLYQQRYEFTVKGKKETVLWQRIHTDHDFLKTYSIPIVAGRDFSKLVASDSSNFIINEAAARILGLTSEEAVGIDVYGNYGKVIGVMKDFHFKTLHSGIEPMIIHIVPDRVRMLTVNIGASDANSTMRWIADQWKEVQPDQPFVYTTLSGFNAENYRFEEKFGKVIVFFTLIVFLLSVSGLVSLNVYIANLRRKEIGIRKVLGAETGSLLVNLSRRFAVIALVGFVLSLPLSWYALTTWLEGFAYKVDLTPGIFIGAGLITFVLSMISIALPTLRAARQNVVKVLRSAE